MKPILTAEEMAAVDRRATETVSLEVLIERAGTAIARHGLEILGGAYARRVLVVAGRGHNGDDARVAARLLTRRGAKVRVAGVGEIGTVDEAVDLVIDGAYGTGFHGDYAAPKVPDSMPVLAVDIPSGLLADDGSATPGAVRASRTVTFGAYKPGLFQGSGPGLVGDLVLEEIGLGVTEAQAHLVEDGDLARIPSRGRDAHKWKSALFILAGSPEVRGAADLSVGAALRTGAGMVRTGSPGVVPGSSRTVEAVTIGLEAVGFAKTVVGELERCAALVAGPGLGINDANRSGLAELLGATKVPAVLDADALTLLGSAEDAHTLLSGRAVPAILTPHDGEFARLAGSPPGPDRLRAARDLADRIGAIVLLKGPTTIVAAPGGETLFVTSGSTRLATAGTGDVLSGVIGALLARGLPPLEAAGIGAHLHGRAASLGRRSGLVASDLAPLLATVLSGIDPDQ